MFMYSGASYLYIDHLSSRRNEDYKAHEIFSGRDRHNSSTSHFVLFLAPLFRTSERSTTRPSFANAGEKRRTGDLRNTTVYVFVSRRAWRLINVSISCRELHCYVAIDRGVSRKEIRWNASAPIGTKRLEWMKIVSNFRTIRIYLHFGAIGKL